MSEVMQQGVPDWRVAVVGSHTTDLFARSLGEALPESQVKAGRYNGLIGEMLEEGSWLFEWQPGVVVVQWHASDLLGEAFAAGSVAEADAAVDAVWQSVEAGLVRLRERLPDCVVLTPTLYVPDGDVLEMLSPATGLSWARVVSRFNAKLRDAGEARQLCGVIEVDPTVRRLGVANVDDARLWYLAGNRQSGAGMAAFAELHAVVIRRAMGQVCKVVVVDLDNTLWGGVLGEEGMDGVLLGPDGVGAAYVEFQRGLKRLTRAGVLLAINSKNDHEHAMACLAEHPHMVLRPGDFACARINWQDKAVNIREIAQELSLGEDSLVFIDDNPAERHRVAEATRARVPSFAEDPADLPVMLAEIARQYFPIQTVTQEDAARAEQYAANRAREEAAGAATSMEAYLTSLEMKATLAVDHAGHVARVAQMLGKTNQFNLTTRRHSLAVVQGFVEREDAHLFTASLADRFGDNGVVIAALVERQGDRWVIDSLLMSCRAIGRGLEGTFVHHMLQWLREDASLEVIGEYRPTERNGQVCEFWASWGFEPMDEEPVGGGSRWRLPVHAVLPEASPWIEVDFVSRGELSDGLRQTA